MMSELRDNIEIKRVLTPLGLQIIGTLQFNLCRLVPYKLAFCGEFEGTLEDQSRILIEEDRIKKEIEAALAGPYLARIAELKAKLRKAQGDAVLWESRYQGVHEEADKLEAKLAAADKLAVAMPNAIEQAIRDYRFSHCNEDGDHLGLYDLLPCRRM